MLKTFSFNGDVMYPVSSRKILCPVVFLFLLLQPLYAYTVLWDRSHGAFSSDYIPSTSSGFYQAMAMDLQDNDFSIQTTNTGFDQENFTDIDVAVVCAATSISVSYNTAEINALKSFVAGGGGLLLMCDVGNSVSVDLAGEFGFSFGSWISTTNPAGSLHITTANLSDHPVFDSVDAIHMYYALDMTVPGSAQSIAQATTSGGQQVDIAASFMHGSGRVIVLSDSSLWSVQSGANYDHYFQDDNQQFAISTFEHLVDTDYVPEPATLALLLVGAVLLRLRVK